MCSSDLRVSLFPFNTLSSSYSILKKFLCAQGHIILQSYPLSPSGKTSVEVEEPEVASDTENPTEDASEDEEEIDSPHHVPEENPRKRRHESGCESEGMGKETSSSIPLASTTTSSSVPASSSAAPDDAEVLNVIPLAYKPPPPGSKKPRVSTRWNVFKGPVIHLDDDK